MFPRLICLAALLAAAPAFADTPINQTRPLAADGHVAIDNLKGRIVVRTWDRPEVRITGNLGEGVEKLLVEGDQRELRIVVQYPENRGGWLNWGGGDKAGPSVVEVSVPARASVEAESVSADIDVTGVGGSRLAAESVSGDILVRGVRVAEASFENVSGDIDAELDGSQSLSVESVSGDILVRGRIGGRIALETVSGDATLETATIERLEMSTVSGDGRLSAGLAPSGNITADSVSGNVDLVLPRDTSARLRIETFSGGISSPVGQVKTEEYGPGKHLDAKMGSGSGQIRLESFSGNVQVTVK